MVFPMPRQRLFLIDTFGFIFRAFHARGRQAVASMRTSTGIPTEAVYIFNNMLRKLTAAYKPDYIAAVFESAGPTFREQEFAEYKANRVETPPDLTLQIPYVRRLIESMRIPILEYPGFEADDVIGAIARRAEQSGLDVAIVSSDKDMLQLVNDHVSMFNPIQDDLWYDAAKVEEKMGVKPEQVADLLALKGDAVDNIPGAPGIGDKGARDLLVRFGSLDAVLARAAEVERKMYRESLEQNRDRILLSKHLATIDTSVPIEFHLDAVRTQEPDTAALKQIYKELEFFSLAEQLGPEEDTRPRDYAALDTPESVAAFLNAIPPDAPTAIAAAPPDEPATDMFEVGTHPAIGLAWRPGQARAVTAALVEELRPFLEDATRPKIAHDTKQATLALASWGIEARGFQHDVMLYAFLLNADPGGCSLEMLARRRLDRKLEPALEHHADCALELAAPLGREVDERGFRWLYDNIDLPLARVLTRMERRGVRVDPVELRRLSALMDTEVQRLAAEIYALAGKSFNIKSPQQLG
jgi:DNA polymerase-1